MIPRDAAAQAWKEHSREMFRQRQDARAELARFQRLAGGWITEAQAEATEAVTRAETAELRAEKAEQPRPLTADDITDEMVDRGLDALDEEAAVSVTIPTMRAVLTSAVTEPPARAEAEDYARTPRMNVGTVRDRIAEAHLAGIEWARTHLAEEVRKAKAEAWQEGVNFALPGKETYWISKHSPHRATETGDSDEH